MKRTASFVLSAPEADCKSKTVAASGRWMPVDRSKGLFRIAWVAVSVVGLSALIAASIAALLA